MSCWLLIYRQFSHGAGCRFMKATRKEASLNGWFEESEKLNILSPRGSIIDMYWYLWSGWTNASSGRLTISSKLTSQVISIDLHSNIHWCFQTKQVLFHVFSFLVWALLHLQLFSDNELVGQIGDGDVDHAWWGRPEEMTMNRFPVMMVMMVMPTMIMT